MPYSTPGQELRRHGRRAVGQISLCLTIWALLQALLDAAVLVGPLRPVLGRAFQQAEQVTPGRGGSFTLTISADGLARTLLASGEVVVWFSATALLATLAAIVAMHRLAGGPGLLDLGLRPARGWLGEVALGLVLGPVAFLVIVSLELLTGWTELALGRLDAPQLGLALAAFTCGAVSEELLARGFVLRVLERDYGTPAAVVGSSVLFTTLHAVNPGFGPAALLGLFAGGLLFAYAYLATRRLWLPIGLHLSWNFAEGPLFGLAVSGLPVAGLLEPHVAGPALATGGAFGPEAGVLGLIGMGVAAGLIALWRVRAVRSGVSSGGQADLPAQLGSG
jgi:membrane protease YdiL (CAAX protease family)